MHNPLEQATTPAKKGLEKLGSSADPIKLQRPLSTLLQHSSVRQILFTQSTNAQFEGGWQTHWSSSWNCVPQIRQAYILVGIA